MINMSFQHKELAAGAWQKLSLVEQMGNIGSEVSRMLRWRQKDVKLFQGAFERALELMDLTMADPRWRKRLKEIVRAREVLCDAATGGKEYGSSLADMNRYFFDFARAARKNR